jgi:hypothetical protein
MPLTSQWLGKHARRLHLAGRGRAARICGSLDLTGRWYCSKNSPEVVDLHHPGALCVSGLDPTSALATMNYCGLSPKIVTMISFAELFRRYSRKVFQACPRYSATTLWRRRRHSETFLRGYQKKDRFREGDSPIRLGGLSETFVSIRASH